MYLHGLPQGSLREVVCITLILTSASIDQRNQPRCRSTDDVRRKQRDSASNIHIIQRKQRDSSSNIHIIHGKQTA